MITITDAAATELKQAIAQEKSEEQIYVRVSVKGGGCSGFQHALTLDAGVNEKADTVYEINGVKVLIDKRSALYLEGAIVDWVNDLNRRGFKITNPKSKGTCGCGSSFSM